VLGRLWGSDLEYLARHRERYQAVVREQHELRARWLLRRGRRGEARQELGLAGGGRLGLRMLSALPAFVVTGASRVLKGPPGP
jgi:hypothetical protein